MTKYDKVLRLGTTRSRLFIDCVSPADVGVYTCVAETPTLRIATTFVLRVGKGAITSKIKHAIKHKTSRAILAQLLQPSLAFCCSLQTAANDGVPSSTGRYAVIGCKLKQNANEGCNSCASLAGLVLCFIACFILLVIAPLDTFSTSAGTSHFSGPVARG